MRVQRICPIHRGGDQRDQNVIKILKILLSTSKLFSLSYLIRECDDLINGLEADLAIARSGLKRSEFNKDINELRLLIHDCDNLITI